MKKTIRTQMKHQFNYIKLLKRVNSKKKLHIEYLYSKSKRKNSSENLQMIIGFNFAVLN